eukprot:2596-Heterococcus_DN1.PRE.2
MEYCCAAAYSLWLSSDDGACSNTHAAVEHQVLWGACNSKIIFRMLLLLCLCGLEVHSFAPVLASRGLVLQQQATQHVGFVAHSSRNQQFGFTR